jgi:origin recognition complex subunit 4
LAGIVLRRKLFCAENVRFTAKDVPENKKEVLRTVKGLLERTILQSEGNSVLIIGPRGSGKTWVLNSVFDALHNDKRCKSNYIKVYLNGIVHTDDRLALLEIARQLDVEDELGERISLSFAAALNYLLEALRSGSHCNQSVVFVLDEFDQFAHHKNQSLLYNLLDTSQSAHNPIAVIGLTCRLDVVELLEKRVKSRFSHRQILLFPHTEFDDYVRLASSLLTLPDDFKDDQYRQQWQENIEKLLQNSSVLQSLQRQFRISADVRSLKTLLLLPVSQLSAGHPHLTPSDFALSLSLLHRDSAAEMLAGLSVLELCLLIAVSHLSDLTSGEPFNFEMVYGEYKKFARRAQSMEVFSQPVALKTKSTNTSSALTP